MAQKTAKSFNHPTIYLISQPKNKNLALPQNTAIKTLVRLACFIWPVFIFSQPPVKAPAFITINEIIIEGNKRTKETIVLRELDFDIGDTIHLSGLVERIRENEYNILNTGLFTTAQISYNNWEGETNRVELLIKVKEDWYIFPFPILELADRNFNVWWTRYNRSLRRLNVGVRFYHTNLTGRRDLLKAVVQFGFTQKYELDYTFPALNKAQTIGANFNVLHTREKEIGYTTFENRLIFTRNDEDILLQRFRIGGGIFFRKKIDVIHALNLTYRRHQLHEEIALDLNPNFFLDERTRQEYLSLNYEFSVDKRDIRPYPMNGYFFSGSIAKNGIGLTGDMRSTVSTLMFQQYFNIPKKWSVALAAKGKREWQRETQPYYTSQALGYFEDFIRGYEFYVIDGLDFGYVKKALRFNFLEKEINWGRYMKIESLRNMPVKLFLVWHNELGYVNNPFYKTNNPLSNELLWGTGIGLDMILYYNKVFNFEFSRNRLGEYGFFLHWTFSF
ncbi:MAG: BamA/TamA family outer membrane protein [Bacteroidota bacterium]